jgi:asparagine synthase (glutamine-hydrolysing)
MSEQIAHRGPDDEQLLIEGPFGVAFRRLAIVDVEGGRQPLTNEDGTVVAVVNGEIYNHQEVRATLKEPHRLSTRSDCEVLVHLYEEIESRAFEALVGMYAVAIWDARRRRVILARDRFGIKPLFYAVAGRKLLFASEIKALLRHPQCPRAFDWAAALRAQATDGWLEGEAPTSFFQGIHHVPAGRQLEFDIAGGAMRERAYWVLPDPSDAPDDDGRSVDRITDEYAALLGDAVQKCLMADVEVGLFLSGGIDSVSVAGFAAQTISLHTFTVLTQSTFTNQDARYAHLSAKRFGLPNHQVLFHWHALDVSPDDWMKLLWLCESPSAGPEQLYKYHLHRFARSARPQLKVMLTGQGSDEFNGGYTRQLAPEGDKSWNGFLGTAASWRRAALINTVNPALHLLDCQLEQPVFSSSVVERIPPTGRPEDVAWGSFVRRKYLDLQMYNCWHEDRIAAGNSIENRVPFLDHRLVDYVLSVPRRHRALLFWDKAILRRAVGRLLPAELRSRPKVPFFHGDDQRFTFRMMLNILTAGGGALLEEAFDSMVTPVFDRRAIDKVVARTREDPEATYGPALLTLANMSLLEKMAQAAAGAPIDVRPRLAPELRAAPIEDWDEQAESLAQAVARKRPEIGGSTVLGFSDRAYLVKRSGGQADPEWYLVVDDRIQYVLVESGSPGWIRCLELFDGKRRLAEIIDAAGLPLGDALRCVEESLDFGILVIAAQPASTEVA